MDARDEAKRPDIPELPGTHSEHKKLGRESHHQTASRKAAPYGHHLREDLGTWDSFVLRSKLNLGL